MQLKRTSISIFLLLTYFLGFSHDLIPHHHGVETHTHTAEHTHEGSDHKHGVHEHNHHSEGHHHHSKQVAAHEDHQHLEHGNHYDGNLFDLLVCCLSDLDHNKKGCDYNQYVASSTQSITSLTNKELKAITLLAALVTTNSVIFHAFTSEEVPISYLSPPIDDAPRRGPPALNLA